MMEENKSYTCSLCPLNYATKQARSKHIKYKHPDFYYKEMISSASNAEARRKNHNAKYNEKWEKNAPWLKRCTDKYSAYCALCDKRFKVDFAAFGAVKLHARGKKHTEKELLLQRPDPTAPSVLDRLKQHPMFRRILHEKKASLAAIKEGPFERAARVLNKPFPQVAIEQQRNAPPPVEEVVEQVDEESSTDDEDNLPLAVFKPKHKASVKAAAVGRKVRKPRRSQRIGARKRRFVSGDISDDGSTVVTGQDDDDYSPQNSSDKAVKTINEKTSRDTVESEVIIDDVGAAASSGNISDDDYKPSADVAASDDDSGDGGDAGVFDDSDTEDVESSNLRQVITDLANTVKVEESQQQLVEEGDTSSAIGGNIDTGGEQTEGCVMQEGDEDINRPVKGEILSGADDDEQENEDDGTADEFFDQHFFPNYDLLERPSNTKSMTMNCRFCAKFCESIESTEAHEKKHTAVKDSTFACFSCPSVFTSEELRDAHDTAVHDRVGDYECFLCGEKFSERIARDDHLYHDHGGVEQEICTDCEMVFDKRPALLQHQIAVHGMAIGSPCIECPAWFAYKNLLVNHMKEAHTGQNPYQCDECGSKFSRVSILTRHKQSHTGVKPYQCDQCGVGYTQKTGLDYHIRDHHSGNGSHPTFCCDICGKVFARKNYLRSHTLNTHGDKKHKCHICGKMLKRYCSLSRHLKDHAADADPSLKPHKCSLCSKSFRAASFLSKHQLGHLKRADKLHHTTTRRAAPVEPNVWEQEQKLNTILVVPQHAHNVTTNTVVPPEFDNNIAAFNWAWKGHQWT